MQLYITPSVILTDVNIFNQCLYLTLAFTIESRLRKGTGFWMCGGMVQEISHWKAFETVHKIILLR